MPTQPNKAHTPGPWITDDHHEKDLFRHVMNGNGRCAPYICRLPLRNGDNPTQEQEANARLIAAAPDLLEALIDVLRVADRKTDEFDKARAAIARATGSSSTGLASDPSGKGE